MDNCHVFIDESGDFGFSKKSSRHITLSAVIVSNKIALERTPRKVRRQLKTSVEMKPELKFHDSDDAVKRKVLGMFASLPDMNVVCIVADKAKMTEYYRSHRSEMYDRMCGSLLEHVLRSKKPRKLDIYFDVRPRNKPKGRDFDRTILNEIENHSRRLGIITPSVFISRVSSERSRGLIVADFVSGAIQRKHEHGSLEYYGLISDSIIIEKEWNP